MRVHRERKVPLVSGIFAPDLSRTANITPSEANVPAKLHQAGYWSSGVRLRGTCIVIVSFAFFPEMMGRALRVLIVEDEPRIGMDLAAIVEALGFDLAGPAISSTDAYILAAVQSPDIAIVDMNLIDGPTGPSVASRLANHYGTDVLVLTANPELVVKSDCRTAAVLTKPYDASQIADHLTLLASRRLTA